MKSLSASMYSMQPLKRKERHVAREIFFWSVTQRVTLEQKLGEQAGSDNKFCHAAFFPPNFKMPCAVHPSSTLPSLLYKVLNTARDYIFRITPQVSDDLRLGKPKEDPKKSQNVQKMCWLPHTANANERTGLMPAFSFLV